MAGSAIETPPAGATPVFRGFFEVRPDVGDLTVVLDGRRIDVIAIHPGRLTARAKVRVGTVEDVVADVPSGSSRIWLPSSVDEMVLTAAGEQTVIDARAEGSIRTSPRSSRTSWAFTSTRPRTQSCLAATRSRIQALDRTQPPLPFQSGRSKTITHDYERHGASTLFEALNILTGAVISMCAPRHRHTEWLTFLKLLGQSTPQHFAIHVIADNYATQKHAKVKRWLARHPRFRMRSTPTSASWLNMVERFIRGHHHEAHPSRSLAERPALGFRH